MAPPFLVVVVVPLLVFLQDPSTASAVPQECSRADLFVEDTLNVNPVLSILSQVTNYKYQSSFLQAGEYFQGVGVELRDAAPVRIFFPAYEHCFPGPHSRWWPVKVGCHYSTRQERVTCFMFGGDCHWRCTKNHTLQGDLPDPQWLAHGPSGWRVTRPPDTCAVQEYEGPPSHEHLSCSDPLDDQNRTTTNATINSTTANTEETATNATTTSTTTTNAIITITTTGTTTTSCNCVCTAAGPVVLP